MVKWIFKTFFNFIHKSEYDRIIKVLINSEEKIKKLERAKEEQIPIIIKDFDALLNAYTANEINALSYKIIQKAYQENNIELLKRWFTRINSAINDKSIDNEELQNWIRARLTLKINS